MDAREDAGRDGSPVPGQCKLARKRGQDTDWLSFFLQRVAEAVSEVSPGEYLFVFKERRFAVWEMWRVGALGCWLQL